VMASILCRQCSRINPSGRQRDPGAGEFCEVCGEYGGRPITIDVKHLTEVLDMWKRRSNRQGDDSACMAIAECIDDLEHVVKAAK
jgi:hypothetical protein